jgi:lysophospholipase
MKTIITTVVLLFTTLTFAVDETNYRHELTTKVIPFYKKNVKTLSYKVDGKNVVAEYINQGKDKLLVIFPGRTEPSNKYQEVAYDLKDLGYDFLLVNHRAQGLSERILKDQQKGHIKNFDHYVESALVIIDETLKKKNYSSVTLLAHSMGNLIGLKIHQERPELFNKMILSSPMLDIITAPFSETQALLLTKTLTYTGFSAKYVQGHGPTTARDREFENNRVTSSPARWKMARDLEDENNFLIMGGATNRWTYQSLKHSRALEKDFKHLRQVPVLMFTAGKEFYVLNQRAQTLCQTFKGNCQYTHFPTALHELFQERDEFRNNVMGQIKHFLSR